MRSMNSHAVHVTSPDRDVALMWFRRDLRDYDNAALRAALSHQSVHCVFVFDTDILAHLEARDDRRVSFIWESVRELHAALAARGGGLRVLHGPARELVPDLARSLGAKAVYANRDYEPDAIRRDAEVSARLARAGIAWREQKDQVIFEAPEIRTQQGNPFAVFTPYYNAWRARLGPGDMAAHDIDDVDSRLAPDGAQPMPSLDDIGFRRAELPVPAGMSGAAQLWTVFRKRLARYAGERNEPALAFTSHLSVHLRFGTVSIRELVRHAFSRRNEGATVWLRELAWRDFYFAILTTRPDVVERSFRREFDRLTWNTDDDAFDLWRAGRTGYPLVDAAMRELHAQGTMHNRLRMVVASFLVKHLGIDWRRGERYFAAKLLDYDLAANNGNWQWCASTGCDAQPWFRIFNPIEQSRRYDADGVYVRRWIPELAHVPGRLIHTPWEMSADDQRAAGCIIGTDYPTPMVEHSVARQQALARYGAVAGA
jgi:deoxyribodipyrimidine photo-lyase